MMEYCDYDKPSCMAMLNPTGEKNLACRTCQLPLSFIGHLNWTRSKLKELERFVLGHTEGAVDQATMLRKIKDILDYKTDRL